MNSKKSEERHEMAFAGGLRGKVVRFESRALKPPVSWERQPKGPEERPRLTARKRVQVEEPQWYSSLRRLTLGGC